jgi:mannan endo-1,4-beta-mannosidase
MTSARFRLAVGGLALVAAAALTSACSAVTSGSTPGQAGLAGQAAGGGSTSAAAQPPASSAPTALSAAELTHPDGKFFGIEAQGAPASLGPADDVAAAVGHNPNLLGQYVAWGSPFDANAATNAKNYGALYYMAWEPFSQSVASIANGASDSYITTFAKAVQAFGGPVALSFGHEMNGNWYPWGTTDTTAAEFVAAWQHIHDLFAAAGATNVIWIWNPNIINPMPDVQLEPYWPGNADVDWVGLTGYFPTTGPDTFAGIYGPTMTEVRTFTSKPFIIAETSVETGPDQLASIRNLIGGVEASSDVLGFVWFNFNKAGVDWSVSDRPVVRAALASGIAGMHLASLQG